MPDARGIVDFKIGGTRFAFKGVAYHDKNWGDQPFQDNVASWYWGHGRLGPYSIVWFDVLDVNGTNYVSAYASEDSEIITAACDPGSIKVRPVGANSQYPPASSSGGPGGFSIEIELTDGNMLDVNVTIQTQILIGGGQYYRWTGSLVGGVRGFEVLDGV